MLSILLLLLKIVLSIHELGGQQLSGCLNETTSLKIFLTLPPIALYFPWDSTLLANLVGRRVGLSAVVFDCPRDGPSYLVMSAHIGPSCQPMFRPICLRNNASKMW